MDTAPQPATQVRALGILATTAVLAILYVGRDVLVPITLAVILSLLIAPAVRRLRHFGLGQTFSVLAAVLVFAAAFGAGTAIIGTQLVRMAGSFPQYEHTIRRKLQTLNELTVGRLNSLTGRADRVISQIGDKRTAPRVAPTLSASESSDPVSPIAVELHEPPTSPVQLIERVIASVWVPLETAGIVLVVLVFVLLEHEALRDRLIRIAGGADVRRTTIALNDAGARLSKFFISQFAVNVAVGAIIAVGLMFIGLPHALLWGTFAAVMRFVPYVGIWIAAFIAALLAAAVDPGWSLAIMTFSLFAVVDTIAGQLVEPQLFGHTTGLSPLSVVIAAIFWSSLWGPVGLVVSTPLTLCLLVAGRNFKALSLLDILLSDTHALTMPQRFYQRALSADSDEIIASARDFLKRNSFAAYCDTVLVPAVHLARLDLEAGTISSEQQISVRTAVVNVITSLGGETRKLPRRRQGGSVLDQSNAGRQLRAQRELLYGKWQGPVQVPEGSVVLCVGLGSMADDLATELLVRILRDQKVDARHISLEDLATPPPGGDVKSVSMIYVVSAFPCEERARTDGIALDLRKRFGDTCIVAVFLPGMLLQPDSAPRLPGNADKTAQSFGDAVQICEDWHRQRESTAA